jgi:hypothetical protein
MWEGLTKKMGKNFKKKLVPRVPLLSTREGSLPRVLSKGTRGRGLLPRVPGEVALGEEAIFPEC